MLDLLRRESMKPSTAVRGFFRLGPLCGVYALMMLVAGCPDTPPPPPTTCPSVACDDGLFCNGVEACDEEANTCVAGDDPCRAGTTCNEATDHCDECSAETAASDCDDGNACTTETCSDAGECVSTDNSDGCDDGDVCTGGDVCVAGTCVGTAIDGCCKVDDDCAVGETCGEDHSCFCGCDSDGDCDDNDVCTTDTCMDCQCSSQPVDCGDGLFCNGTESCDPETGDCVSSGDPCADDPKAPDCDEEADACVFICACTEDADCDDGLFCNGVETCDGACNCIAGTHPCFEGDGGECGDCGEDGSTIPPDETCHEGDAAAVCTPCPVPDWFFTHVQDNLTGTTCDDLFSADFWFDSFNGGRGATLQTGDRLDGLAGNDTLIAALNGGTVVPQSIIDVENIYLFSFNSTVTLSAVNISGVDMIMSTNSLTDVVITDLQETTDFGFRDIPGFGDPDRTEVDMTLTFALESITAGTDDQITCTLENAIVGAAIVITASTDGFEIINIISTGTGTNRLTSLVHTIGTTLHTVVITGSADLELGTVPASVVTIDTSGFAGTLTRLP